MKCLFCNKEINSSASQSEKNSCWHDKCVKKFFGVKVLPHLEIDKTALNELAKNSVNRGYTVTGVQKKLSLHLQQDNGNPRLTLVNYPMGYILKPQSSDYANLPEAEYLTMQMAKAVGIKTVPCALIKNNDGYGYITKRIDRDTSNNITKMLAMEDFCQLDGRLSEDKYKGSYEKCGKIIRKYSKIADYDLTEFFLVLIFSFVVGNSDMHLKNFSLIETSPKSQEYTLAPAYDLLPVNIILPEDSEQMALTVNKRKNKIKISDFFALASTIGLSQKQAENIINSVVKKQSELQKMVKDSYLPIDLQLAFSNLIDERISQLNSFEKQ